MPPSFTRTLRLKVRPESYGWLSAAAIEVNQTFNYCNEASWLAATRTDSKRTWFSGFDLCALTAGASQYFDRIGADTIQRVCVEYAQKRIASRRHKLRWRVSRGARRSLGWVPFKAASLKRQGRALRVCGKTFRVFEAPRLQGAKWKQGCFAQDAVGDWWLCLPLEYEEIPRAASRKSVGIDLGLKQTAVTSEGERLESGRFYREMEGRIAQAQRRGHRRQGKRLHRKVARQRADALHKFSRKMVDRYEYIVVGDVSSTALARTRMAKSVLDCGWGMLKRMLAYKGEHAGRSVVVVTERNTTRACSFCGALTGPTGKDMLVVRHWECPDCAAGHDRDQNSALNIRFAGLRKLASVRGNELLHEIPQVEQDIPVLARYGWGACYATA
jgi:putative transposase